MSASESEKALEFISRIQGDPDTFREQVVSAFAEVYGYDNCDFWLADPQGNIFSPVSSIGDPFVGEYEEKFMALDPTNPKNLGVENALRYPVIALHQAVGLTATDEYDVEGHEYYKSFLEKFNLQHHIALYLQYGGDLVGAVAFLRSDDEGPFNEDDARNLISVAGEISYRLHSGMLLRSEMDRGSIFEDFASESADGLILFGEDLHVEYFNDAVLEICEDYMSGLRGARAVEAFLANFASRAPITWKMGYEKSFKMPSLRRAKLKIMPTRGGGVSSRWYTATLKWDTTTITKQGDRAKDGAGFSLESSSPASSLSPRELDIARLLIDGLTNEQIAQELSLSINTIKKYLSNMYTKLGVKNRASFINRLM